MATNNIPTRMIALSKGTAELFAAKNLLDECFEKVSKAHDDYSGYDSEFESKLYDAFIELNNIIMDLLSEQINCNSTESNYKVI